MNTFNPDQLSDSFERAQQAFDHKIDPTNHATLIQSQSVSSFRDQAHTERGDFRRLPAELLPNMVGSVLLFTNRELGAFSPGVISPHYQANHYSVSMLSQSYDPRIGITDGIRFALSTKAQTQVASFGNHNGRGSFEAGHFSTVLVGTRSSQVANGLAEHGDKATHAVINSGIPEQMSKLDMLALEFKTRVVSSDDLLRLTAFWHPSMETADGSASANYPNAVRLMMGAAVHAIGKKGREDAQILVNSAIIGAR